MGKYEKIILLSTSVYGMWKQQKLNELKFQNENYLEINLTIAIHFVPWGIYQIRTCTERKKGTMLWERVISKAFSGG